MSATNRTDGQRDPDGLDFYETPAWAVRRVLERVEIPVGRWLDPCAGTGAIRRAADPCFDSEWLMYEIEPGRATECRIHASDFFLANVPRWNTCAIFNPPFPMAEAFVRSCLQLADHVLCLQRVNWAAKRGPLLSSHPADVYMLPDRPAFGLNKHGKVGTDATEYAWFHWHKDAFGLFRVLDRTPRAELKEAADRIRSEAKRRAK